MASWYRFFRRAALLLTTEPLDRTVPARRRGRYIREFALEGDDVSANWTAVFLKSQDGERRVIRLDSFQSPAGEASTLTRRKSKKGDASGG